jgi:mono/diheme cytochrome c family protein
MNPRILPHFGALLAAVAALSTSTSAAEPPGPMAQVPTWSPGDLEYFLHGSMSTEVVPEKVFRAFMRAYPDLFPTKDLSHLGLIPDPKFGWPLGFSRREVPHLGGLSSVGINCASCHVTDVRSKPGVPPVRVLGGTAHFDAEAFFGTVLTCTWRTSEPANMKKFLAAYLIECDPIEGERMQGVFQEKWQQQEKEITAAMTADPLGAKGIATDALHSLNGADFQFNHRALASAKLPDVVHAFSQLFHNMRAALHVPDPPPKELPPASGPGRNDAFGLLSLALVGVAQPYAPVKYGLIWNLDKRPWVHWDGNTRSPLGRNMLASLGLGAPLQGKKAFIDFAGLKRHTELTEHILPPRYPFAIDQAAAKRGSSIYDAQCSKCHSGPEGDNRLHTIAEIGTAPQRIEVFTQAQADRLNAFLASLEMPGYEPFKEPGIRGTQKVWAASLQGVWARSPYLHNGSVRTLQELLTAPAARAKTYHRGTQVYDPAAMGYMDEGHYVVDTTKAESSNAGHDYGTALSADEKRDLIEFLKTL